MLAYYHNSSQSHTEILKTRRFLNLYYHLLFVTGISEIYKSPTLKLNSLGDIRFHTKKPGEFSYYDRRDILKSLIYLSFYGPLRIFQIRTLFLQYHGNSF